MEQDLFKSLPSEIINNILLRLDVRSIAISKCVCKSWLDLLNTDEFVKSHLSRSAAATTLAVLTREWNSSRCTVFDLEDKIDVDQSFDCHYNIAERGLICVRNNEVNADALYLCNPLTKLDFSHQVSIECSANGLLFLREYDRMKTKALYVCNPITREYIKLRCHEKDFMAGKATYGFGTSKISGEHKVVCIKHSNGCDVYTLGTGSWRCVEATCASFDYDYGHGGAFVNGNLHWIVYSKTALCISCFDLETECFSTFFAPPFQPSTILRCYDDLSVLRDCLCYCDDLSQKGQLVIWLMIEYGDEKSWTMEYVIRIPDILLNLDIDGAIVAYPIKVFKDGGILMVLDEWFLYYYSNKTKTIQKIGVFNGGNNYVYSMLLTPSLVSLKSFTTENVISL